MAIITLHNDLVKVYREGELSNQISRAKRLFFANEIAISDISFLSKEVGASWARLKKLGKDPYTIPQCLQKNTAGIEHRNENEKYLLRSGVPLIRSHFNQFFGRTGMILTDCKGRILFSKSVHHSNYYQVFPLNARITEITLGTNAVSLCMRHHETVFLFGPEHFYEDYENMISCASPIFGPNNEVIGSLSMIADMEGYKGVDNASRRINVYMIGWTKSLAFAISNQVKFFKEKQKLLITTNVLQNTLSVIDEGILTLNKERRIIQINEIGKTMLGTPKGCILGQPISKYMQINQIIDRVLVTKKPELNLEMKIGDNEESQYPYIVDIFPDKNRYANRLNGCIVIRIIPYISKYNLPNQDINDSVTFQDIITNSAVCLEAVNRARRIAISSGAVLLTGENGVGKELFAQAIHNASGRKGLFVPLNCSAVSRNLVESELFGYESGSFTGADRKGRIGKIELAHGGTLFLDEIGDMPLDLQPVLLRVLQEKRIMRVGSNKYIPVNFRLIAATNKNMLELIEKKAFREDLYYRLAAFKINVPSLRERSDDILLLAEYLLTKICVKEQVRPMRLSPEAEMILRTYNWPGNVRQLENALLYATYMAEPSGIITRETLPEEILDHFKNTPAKSDTSTCDTNTISPLEIQEKNLILSTLNLKGGNINETCRTLNMSRSTLYRRLKKYDAHVKKKRV